MEKKQYDFLKSIKAKIENKQPTTFAERNIYNIYLKRKLKKTKK